MLRYDGDFKDGLFHGEGSLFTPDNTEEPYFEGSFENGLKARGKYIDQEKNEYTGNFKDNKFHGHGHLVDVCNNRYTGNWIQGAKDGSGGEYVWESGDMYMGGFKDDLPHGGGEFAWAYGTWETICYENGVSLPKLDGGCESTMQESMRETY